MARSASRSTSASTASRSAASWPPTPNPIEAAWVAPEDLDGYDIHPAIRRRICSWSYIEIAAGLKDEIADHPVYSDWVAFYLQQEEADLVTNMRETFDDMTRPGAVGDEKRRQLGEIFMMSSRLEGMFWEMAYTLDQWPDLG